MEHNGFEIPRVFPNSKPRLLSSYMSGDVWEYMLQNKLEGRSIAQQWKDAGEDLVLAAETSDYCYDGNVVKVPANMYLPWLAAAEGNIYYHGYWINRGYLKEQFWEILKAELEFAPLTGEKNKEYKRKIAETNSVALHVRRGDFVRLGWNQPMELYVAGVEKIKEGIHDPYFFLFSDDMEWCKENLKKMGLKAEESVFVEGNKGADSYIDMQLMSYCKNVLLITPSSFSYLAALLNINESIFVVNGTGREV